MLKITIYPQACVLEFSSLFLGFHMLCLCHVLCHVLQKQEIYWISKRLEIWLKVDSP